MRPDSRRLAGIVLLVLPTMVALGSGLVRKPRI
jgi:hypothetical protein